MGEAKITRTKNQILYYGGLLVQLSTGRDDLTQRAPPEKAPRNICFVFKRRHHPSAEEMGSLRSYFSKDRRHRAVNSVLPQTTRGRQHSSGSCRVLLRNTWSSARDKTFWRQDHQLGGGGGSGQTALGLVVTHHQHWATITSPKAAEKLANN